MSTLLSVAVVLLLVAIEGLFVAAEIALVSLREGQVKALSARGRGGAAVARLAENPNRWLATVQIGVTLTALLSSAFGAITLSQHVRDALVDHHVGRTLAGFIGVVGVTLAISYVTLVIGGLAPKRIALQRPEPVARFFGPILDRIARGARPVIWLLSVSTDGV